MNRHGDTATATDNSSNPYTNLIKSKLSTVVCWNQIHTIPSSLLIRTKKSLLLTMAATPIITHPIYAVVGFCLMFVTIHHVATFERCLPEITTKPSTNYTATTILGEQIISQKHGGYVHPPIVYGHVHMEKTAGTTLNGVLASHFDNVCGHKGYSYDYNQYNKRTKEYMDEHDGKFNNHNGDSINKLNRGYSRGRVPHAMMDEIGFESCDYISLEQNGKKWHEVASIVQNLELHVPCRDSLEHLMSMCNFHFVTFDCDVTKLEASVEKCHVNMERFSSSWFNDTNIKSVKCFEGTHVDPYVEYMSDRLIRKRFETEYVFRESNKDRIKEEECIWSQPKDIQEEVKRILREKSEYFRFCDSCLGSDNDLLVEDYIIVATE